MQKKRWIRVIIAAAIALGLFFPVLSDGVRDIFGYSNAVLSYYGSRGDEVVNIQKKTEAMGLLSR